MIPHCQAAVCPLEKRLTFVPRQCVPILLEFELSSCIGLRHAHGLLGQLSAPGCEERAHDIDNILDAPAWEPLFVRQGAQVVPVAPDFVLKCWVGDRRDGRILIHGAVVLGQCTRKVAKMHSELRHKPLLAH